MGDPVLVRQFSPGDLAYVFSTWLRDLRDADSGPLPDDLWFPAQRAMIERVLSDPSVVCLVAAASDEPNEILGYVVARPGEILWWIQVRKGLRGRGLAKLLLEKAGATPGTPAAWGTVQGKLHLLNPPRGRRVRDLLRATVPGSPSLAYSSAAHQPARSS